MALNAEINMTQNLYDSFLSAKSRLARNKNKDTSEN